MLSSPSLNYLELLIRVVAGKIADITKSAFTLKVSVSKLEIIFPNNVSVVKVPFLSGENPFATVKL